MARILCGEQRYPLPLLATAGYGLPGAARRFPSRPLPDSQWSELLAAAAEHRVTGLLRAAVTSGTLPTTREQVLQARALHRSAMFRVLRLERELISVVDQLSLHEVDVRVLKGAAVARLDYRDPGVRSFIDIDILVRPADIDRTVRLLEKYGLRRTLPEPRPGFDRRFDKGVTMKSGTGYELDLHRTFVLGPWGLRVGLNDLWDGFERFEIGSCPMYALSGVNRFLHACYHAALGNWPLRPGSLRDIAEMLPAAERQHAAVVERANRWGVEAIVAAAISDTLRLLAFEATGELATWAKEYVPTSREEAWLALHTQADKTFTALALASVPAIPGVRNKLSYLRALALPDDAYTSGRHYSATGRFGYAVREARRGRLRT